MGYTVSVRSVVAVLAALLVVAAAPARAQVDSGLAGLASDETGAVLPGVTVEASSPALIEGVRVAITDGAGRYTITALRPGTYSVTFTLPGFSTFVREGIELTGGFTATVDAVMSVGALEETITVSGASPVVDIQNARAQEVIERETFDALPLAGGYSGLQVMTVGALGSLVNPTGGRDVGGVRGDSYSGAMQVHGNSDGKLALDGKPTSFRGTRMTLFHINQQSVEEVVVDIGGNSAETQYGGSSVNIITKEGGNFFSGSFAGNYAPRAMQSNNLSSDLMARGISEPNRVKKLYDVGGSFGGPVVRDKLWFYTAHRLAEAQEYLAGIYYNRLQGQPFYEPDLDRQGFSQAFDRDNQVKFTWQASERNKFNFQWVVQHNCGCFFGQSAARAPEATFPHYFTGPFGGQHMVNGTWTLPATNRLLIEAKASYWYVFNELPAVPGVSVGDIAALDLETGRNFGQLFTTNPFTLRASWVNTQGGKGDQGDTSQDVKLSYVTGSHSFKVGFQSIQQRYTDFSTGPSYGDTLPPIQYIMRGRVPEMIAQLAAPNKYNFRMVDLGMYAQDSWTIDRLTLNLGVRYDYTTSFSPEFTSPGGFFLEESTWPAMSDFSNFHDFTPRVALAYDLTGSGSTALKFNIGRYVLNEGMARILALHPSIALTNQATRTWNDDNNNLFPDCNLQSNLANGECGATSGAGFGIPTPILEYTDRAQSGWGNRPYSWTTSLLLEHELAPGIAASVGYYRNTLGNITRVDNRLASPADYDEFCVTQPTDSRLPGGGGGQVCGLYDIKPSLFGQFDNIWDLSNFAETYQGIDFLINARFDNGAFIQGGFNTGETRVDRCDAPDFPEQFCDRASLPWKGQHNIKLQGQYPLPGGLVTSATFLNLPGISRNAAFRYSNAQIAPTLGRDLSACGARTGADCSASVNVQLYPNDNEFEKRQTQVDWRIAANIFSGDVRFQPRFEIYNLFNANDVQGQVGTYGTAWLNAAGILTARLFKFAVQIDF